MTSASNTPQPSSPRSRRLSNPLLWILRSPADPAGSPKTLPEALLGRAVRTLLPGVGLIAALILVGFYLPTYTIPNRDALQFGATMYPFSRNVGARVDLLLVLGLGAGVVINWGILGFAKRRDFPRGVALVLAFILGVVPCAIGLQMIERAFIGEPLNAMLSLLATQGVFDTELWLGALAWVAGLVLPALLWSGLRARFALWALGLTLVIFFLSPYLGLGYRFSAADLTYPHELARLIFGVLFGLSVATSLLLAEALFPQPGGRLAKPRGTAPESA